MVQFTTQHNIIQIIKKQTMSSDSDEDDYMSDKFLSKCIKEDKRPGLIQNRIKQREYKVATKKLKIDEEQKRKNKPNERERLEEGLKCAISTKNKGFALLAKMGYKQGESLGKSSTKGITEPINITIKSNRCGLGREAAIRELQQKKEEIRRKRLLQKANITQEISTEEYRKRMIKKAEERFIEIDLGKSQRACEKLDQENEIQTPEFSWFWPDRTLKTNEEKVKDENEDSEVVEDEDEVEFEPIEKLEMITDYLRMSYNYCHWCGVHYNDNEDMIQNCPGPTKDDH